jgi:surfactin synthase thioesterase subunit
MAGNTKDFFKYFSRKLKKNCAMLDRSIPTRKALVHSIPINVVKDMTNDVLRALKASLSEKKL